MCEHEIVGDWYRGCQHFHGRYYTGERVDCGSQWCKTSSAHIHGANTACRCEAVVRDKKIVQNMIQAKHPDCK